MTLVKVTLTVLVPLIGIGVLIAALESVAPNPSGRYAAMPHTASVQELPDPEQPNPPCFIP